MAHYSQAFSALTSGSTTTSGPFFVGDFRLLTFSWSTVSTVPSRITIQGSNADGLAGPEGSGQTVFGGATSLTAWSLVTGINIVALTPGMVTFDPPGYRWVRATIEPTGSAITGIFYGVSF